MKNYEVGGVAYNFRSAGIKHFMKVSYDIPSESKISFLFQRVNVAGKYAKATNPSFRPFPRNYECASTMFHCLYANVFDRNLVATVAYQPKKFCRSVIIYLGFEMPLTDRLKSNFNCWRASCSFVNVLGAWYIQVSISLLVNFMHGCYSTQDFFFFCSCALGMTT